MEEGSLGPEMGRDVDAGMKGVAVGVVAQMLVVGVGVGAGGGAEAELGAQSWGLESLWGSQEGSGAVAEGL